MDSGDEVTAQLMAFAKKKTVGFGIHSHWRFQRNGNRIF